MNNDFIDQAFSDEEKAAIKTVTLKTPGHPTYKTKGSWDTKDRVFCLSLQEVKKYMPAKSSRKSTPTPYTIACQAYVSAYDGDSWWWLRTPGTSHLSSSVVAADGLFMNFFVDLDIGTVRPAMWVDLMNEVF